MLFGDLRVADLRDLGELWGPMGEIIGVAIHHSVSDNEVDASNDPQAILAIRNYHTESKGWPGIGYNFVVGDDGHPYYVGDVSKARAHVWGRNDELVGICLLGTYTRQVPPQEQVEGCARIIAAVRRHLQAPNLPWDGHKNWAKPESPTSCPGDQWRDYKVDIQAALQRVEREVAVVSGAGARHNSVARWFSDRVLRPGPYADGGQDAIWRLRDDFDLSPAARWVEVELFLEMVEPGGAVMLFDGGSADGGEMGYAGSVSVAEGGHGTIVVQLDNEGKCRARTAIPVKTKHVGCLRWWP